MGSAIAAISISDCPTPDRLEHDQVVGQCGEHPDGGRDGGGQAAEMPARRDRPDEDVGVVDMSGHSDPVTQQRTPAVRRRRVDGKHRNAHPAFAVGTHQRTHSRRLPRSRRTRHADDPRCGDRAKRIENFVAARTFDQAQQSAGGSGGSAARRLDELVDGHRYAVYGAFWYENDILSVRECQLQEGKPYADRRVARRSSSAAQVAWAKRPSGACTARAPRSSSPTSPTTRARRWKRNSACAMCRPMPPRRNP